MIVQLCLAIFGLLSITMAMGGNARLRKWAPVVGLAGQPFWFLATVPTGQWGMVVLCIAYTVVYVWGIRVQWGRA